METHPVPQNISSYEFRLVGDMTLKQFLQLAGGTVLAIVAYNMPVPGIIKYPLVFVFALFGVLLAFVPINNRPFSQWLWAFFKAIYSPTEFVWVPTVPAAEVAAVPKPSTTAKTPAPDFSSIFSLFKRPAKSTPATIPSSPTVMAEAPVVPPPSIPTPSAPVVERIISIEPIQKDTSRSEITSLHQIAFASDPSSPVSTPKTEEKTVFKSVPEEQRPNPTLDTNPTQAPNTSPVSSLNTPPILTKTAPVPQATSATTPPQYVTAPTVANVLAGVVSTLDNKLIEGVTVEIIDSTTGIPARALRTNRVGQFQIAIPLANGTYVVNAEKDGYLFEPVSITADGHLIPPVTLSAKTT